MAASVAAELKEEDIEVETVRGGFGEFAITVDGSKVVSASRFLTPRISDVLSKVRAVVNGQKASAISGEHGE